MADEEELSRRLEDVESKMDELEDLQLSNRIELLELKSLMDRAGESLAAEEGNVPGGKKGREAPEPPPKDIIKAIENLKKAVDEIGKRVERLDREVEELKSRAPEDVPPAPEPEMDIDIDSQLNRAKEIMGGDEE